MLRRRLALLVLPSAAACSIDAVLEGPQPPTPIKVGLTLQSSTVTVAPGDSTTLIAAATRLDDSKGNLTFSVVLPPHFDATVVRVTTTGNVTTATITIRAEASVTPSSYFATVHVAGEPAGGASVSLTVRVAPHPGIGVTPVKQVLAIIPGGIAPLKVSVSRTAVDGPVVLTLVAPAGISLAGPTDPVDGSSATVTLAVGSGVAPGTYAVTLRGSAPGVPDSDAPLSIVVSSDALQLLADDVATAQATLVANDVIVNRNGAAGAVTLSADGLPAGVTFSAAPTGGTTATVKLSVGAGTAPGAYTVTLRGSNGGTVASTTFVLTIAASNVAMTLVPQSVAVLQGSAAASVLTLVRTAFAGAVSVELTGVPDGISVGAGNVTITGTTTTLVITTSKDVRPGAYTLTVRAIPLPAGGAGPALDPVSAPLIVTVLEAPTGEGNVVLDWSRCTAPDWVAGQDGIGPWTQLAGAQGQFRFAVTSVRGGIAYTTGARSLTVKFATNAEWTAAPVDMCDPPAIAVPLRTISGITDFSSVLTSSTYTWHLGGGIGTSSLASPTMTIFGVRPGLHDLVGTGTVGAGIGPLVIVRDVSAPADVITETIPIFGPYSITPVAASVRVGVMAAESIAVTESYLTTAACTANEILESGSSARVSGEGTFSVSGIPGAYQRATDYHHIEALATSDAGTRFVSLSVHTVAADHPPSVVLPANLPGYSIVPLPGTHLRLRVSMDAVPVGYGGPMTFVFGDGQSAATIVSSAAALRTAGTGVLLIDMPDFGGTSGFPAGAVPPAGAHGTWTLTLDGSNGSATECAEGASRWSNVRRGTF